MGATHQGLWHLRCMACAEIAWLAESGVQPSLRCSSIIAQAHCCHCVYGKFSARSESCQERGEAELLGCQPRFQRN
jgi:hypothetical protein